MCRYWVKYGGSKCSLFPMQPHFPGLPESEGILGNSCDKVRRGDVLWQVKLPVMRGAAGETKEFDCRTKGLACVFFLESVQSLGTVSWNSALFAKNLASHSWISAPSPHNYPIPNHPTQDRRGTAGRQKGRAGVWLPLAAPLHNKIRAGLAQNPMVALKFAAHLLSP